ncbi:MAG: IclR family transcriptional regulator, partial [Halobacteriaceae archaeon]
RLTPIQLGFRILDWEVPILSLREGNEGVFLFRSQDQYNLKRQLPLGARFPLHCNGAGKAILAELGQEFLEKYIQEFGLTPMNANTITDSEELKTQLNTVRERGFALNLGERDEEVTSVSSVVSDPVKDKIGAISVSIPADSPSTEHLDGKYGEAVRKVTSELSLKLKHS